MNLNVPGTSFVSLCKLNFINVNSVFKIIISLMIPVLNSVVNTSENVLVFKTKAIRSTRERAVQRTTLAIFITGKNNGIGQDTHTQINRGRIPRQAHRL